MSVDAPGTEPQDQPIVLPEGAPAGEWEERFVAVERDGGIVDDFVATLYRGAEGNAFLVHGSVAASLAEVGRFVLHPDNPREGDVPGIAASLDYHGQYKGIVVNRGTHSRRYEPWTVGAGNHTLRAAVSLGWTHVGVEVVDVSDDELDRILLVDNRTSDLAYTRPEAVLRILERMEDPAGTGYDDEWVRASMTAMEPPEPREYGEDAADGVKKTTCPECGHEFPV